MAPAPQGTHELLSSWVGAHPGGQVHHVVPRGPSTGPKSSSLPVLENKHAQAQASMPGNTQMILPLPEQKLLCPHSGHTTLQVHTKQSILMNLRPQTPVLTHTS